MDFSKFKFNKDCIDFLEELESDYGEEIALDKTIKDPNVRGEALVLECKPTIRLNPKLEELEETIIHEAYHLRLKFDGYPLFVHTGLPNRKKYLVNYNRKFHSIIEHSIFFDKIKGDLGLNPFQHGKEFLAYSFKRLPKSQSAADTIGIVSCILQIYIETDDICWQEIMVKEFSKRYGLEAVRLGINLAKLIKATTIFEVKDYVNLYNEVFNILHPELVVSHIGGQPFKSCNNHKVKAEIFKISELKSL